MKIRQMKRLEHSMRVSDNILAKTALKQLNQETKSSWTTWEKMSWDLAVEISKDREHWNNCCNKMSFLRKNLPGTVYK